MDCIWGSLERDSVQIRKHTLYYDYLGLKTSANGNFGLAVNALKQKARRAFMQLELFFFHKIDIPIGNKILDSVTQPSPFMVMNFWVHSVIMTTLYRTSIPQRPYMQNSVSPYLTSNLSMQGRIRQLRTDH